MTRHTDPTSPPCPTPESLRIAHRRCSAALLHPLWWCALIVLVINDHVLKSLFLDDALLHAVTGKISDFAGLVMLPALLVALLRLTGRSVALPYIATAVGFAAVNLSPWLSSSIVDCIAALGMPLRHTADPTDCVALVVLPLSFVLFRDTPLSRPAVSRRWQAAGRAVALLGGAAATMATSMARPPQINTHGTEVLAQVGHYGHVTIVDAKTGHPRLQLETASTGDQPIAASGLLFVGFDGNTEAFDLDTGKRKWTLPPPEGGHRLAPIAASEHRVYVPRLTESSSGSMNWGTDQLLEALDSKTGQTQWSVPASKGRTTPVLLGDKVILTRDNELVVLNAEDGTTLFGFKAPNELRDPIVGVDRLFVGDIKGVLYALDIKTGKLLNKLATGDEGAFEFQYYDAGKRLTYSEGLLFVVVSEELRALDAETLKVRWSEKSAYGFTSSDEGIGVLAQQGGSILGLHQETGTRLYRIDIHDPVVNHPVITNGVLSVRPLSPVLYGFDLETGAHLWTVDLREGDQLRGEHDQAQLHSPPREQFVLLSADASD